MKEGYRMENQQPLTPNSVDSNKTVQTESTMPIPQGEPVSIVPVILIFLAIFFLLVAAIVSIYFFLILPEIKNARNPVKLDSYQIKTSSCQIATYDAVTGAPFYDFVASLGPCDKEYKDLITKAGNSWDKKDYIDLKDSSEMALQKSSTDFQKGVALFWLAHYTYDARDYKSAQEKLFESIKLAPEFADSFSLLTATYNQLKDFANAETYGRKCVKLDSLYAYCHSNLGISLLALGKKDEGYKELEQAISLQPNNQNIRDIYKSEKEFYK